MASALPDSSGLFFAGLFCFLEEFLREFVGIHRVFESLLAEFVSGPVICFAMGFGGNGVGVGCQVMEFRNSGVRALGHDLLLACSMQTGKQCDWNNPPAHT
jgi:hypothetical protein